MPTENDRDRTDDELPDPQLFWRWVGRAIQPWIGWVFIAVGALFVVVGYLGVSRESIVAKQIPYLISGGVFGVFLGVLGAYFLGTEELRRDSGRLDRLEQMVNELHAVLLSRSDAPVIDRAAVTDDADASANGRGRLLVLPDGETFHRPGCAMLEGKTGVTTATPATVRRRQLRPCPLCEPTPVDA